MTSFHKDINLSILSSALSRGSHLQRPPPPDRGQRKGKRSLSEVPSESGAIRTGDEKESSPATMDTSEEGSPQSVNVTKPLSWADLSESTPAPAYKEGPSVTVEPSSLQSDSKASESSEVFALIAPFIRRSLGKLSEAEKKAEVSSVFLPENWESFFGKEVSEFCLAALEAGGFKVVIGNPVDTNVFLFARAFSSDDKVSSEFLKGLDENYKRLAQSWVNFFKIIGGPLPAPHRKPNGPPCRGAAAAYRLSAEFWLLNHYTKEEAKKCLPLIKYPLSSIEAWRSDVYASFPSAREVGEAIITLLHNVTLCIVRHAASMADITKGDASLIAQTYASYFVCSRLVFERSYKTFPKEVSSKRNIESGRSRRGKAKAEVSKPTITYVVAKPFIDYARQILLPSEMTMIKAINKSLQSLHLQVQEDYAIDINRQRKFFAGVTDLISQKINHVKTRISSRKNDVHRRLVNARVEDVKHGYIDLKQSKKQFTTDEWHHATSEYIQEYLTENQIPQYLKDAELVLDSTSGYIDISGFLKRPK